MIRVLLVPSSDYLGHPFLQRHNQIFERLHDGKNFEVHVVRFRLFNRPELSTRVVVHELNDVRGRSAASYYLINMVNHASEIRRIVRQEGIDVVVLANLAPAFAYTLMEDLSRMRVPVVFDLPDYFPTSASGYVCDVRSLRGRLLTEAFSLMLGYMMRRAVAVTAASHALVEYARGVGAHVALRVPNGISEHFLKLSDGNALREKLGFGLEHVVVGYVGSVEFWLDMRSLVEGLALLRKRDVDAKLLIVGRRLHTDYSERVMGWIRRKDLERDTVWLDFVPHDVVPEYMAALDVGTIPFDVCDPTAYYSAPNKMWEYLSQLKPVVSTGIPEALCNRDCALIVSTPQDYAEALGFVAERESHVFEGVKIGYSRALSKTWDRSVRQFATVLNSVCLKS